MGANNNTRRIVRREREASGKQVAVRDLQARDAVAGTLGGTSPSTTPSTDAYDRMS